jgi:hypothetical protein
MINTSTSLFGKRRTRIVHEKPKPNPASQGMFENPYMLYGRQPEPPADEYVTVALLESPAFGDRKTIITAYNKDGAQCGQYLVVYEQGTPPEIVASCHDLIAQHVNEATSPQNVRDKFSSPCGLSMRIIPPSCTYIPDPLPGIRTGLKEAVSQYGRAIRYIHPDDFR